MWYNSIISLLLRSPLHHLLSSSFLLLSYAGRRSGRVYTIPVQYVRCGDKLLITSSTRHTWWRNLRDGACVRIRLGSDEIPGAAQVLEGSSSAAGLKNFLDNAPSLAPYFQVRLNADGSPDRKDVAQAAQSRVIVQIQPLFA